MKYYRVEESVGRELADDCVDWDHTTKDRRMVEVSKEEAERWAKANRIRIVEWED